MGQNNYADYAYPLFPNGPGQIKVGSPLNLYQWIEWDYDPTRGVIFDSELEASVAQNAEAEFQRCIQNGIAAKIRYEKGMARLTIHDSTQTYTLDSWSIGSSDANLSVWFNPIIIADLNVNVVGGALVAVPLIQQALDNNQNADTTFNTTSNTSPFWTYPGNGGYTGTNQFPDGAAYNAYVNYQTGVTDYKNAATGEGYIVRHQTNISNQSLANIADFGTGQIYTTAQLITEITSNALWNNPCPPNLVYEIMNFVEPPPRAYSIVGFFKDRPTREPAANNRINIVTEYIYGQALQSLYLPYGSGFYA